MLRSEPERKRRRFLMLVVCVSAGILFGVWQNRAASRGESSVVARVVRTTTAPLVAGVSATWRWAARVVGPISSARSVAEENRSLRVENAALRERVSNLTEADLSAQRLRRDLGLSTGGFRRRVIAEVIALRPVPGLGTIVINRGTAAGVKPDDVVVAQGGLVGYAFDVGPTTSTVILISDTSVAVGARVARAESRAAGVCRGRGDGSLSMAYLDRHADVRAGDSIVTSGLGGAGGIYPKGITVGTVTRVADDESGATRLVTVRPLVDFGRLEEVYIVR
jgi:rod shape-determining protein MreC